MFTPVVSTSGFFYNFLKKYFEKCFVISIVCFIFALQLKTTTMTTITNTTGSQAVNIVKDATGTIRATYVLIYNGEQQVIRSKDFAKIQSAEKWAKSILG